MSLFLIICCMYGICFTLQYASIFSYPRSLLIKINFFYEMLQCSFCTGFWSGVITYFLINGIKNIDICNVLIYGFSSATICYGIDAVMNYLEHKASND